MKTLKNSIPVYIKTGENYSNIIKYVLKLIEKNQSIKFQFQSQKSEAKIVWDHLESESQFIQLVFYNSIKKSNTRLYDSQKSNYFRFNPI